MTPASVRIVAARKVKSNQRTVHWVTFAALLTTGCTAAGSDGDGADDSMGTTPPAADPAWVRTAGAGECPARTQPEIPVCNAPPGTPDEAADCETDGDCAQFGATSFCTFNSTAGKFCACPDMACAAESECTGDGDCGAEGEDYSTCRAQRDHSCRCLRDECHADGDCGPSKVCLCTGNATPGLIGAQGAPVHVCVRAECRSDADCPDGQPCLANRVILPTDCGGFSIEFLCARADDECRSDSDCGVDAEGQQRFCASRHYPTIDGDAAMKFDSVVPFTCGGPIDDSCVWE